MNSSVRLEEAASFQEALFRNKDLAWSKGEPSAHAISIAGHRVQCHFADTAMPPFILPALAHHPTAGDGPCELDIYIWHGKSTGVNIPDTPWTTLDGSAWQYDTPRNFGVFLPILNSLIWLDRGSNQAIYWTPDASRVPLAEAGSPLLLLLGAWLSGLDIHLVHAAAVSGPRGAALLLGPGGSGKSSTALSCLASPLKYVGDDYCLIRTEPEPAVLSLYCSGKIHRADRSFYPNLGPAYAGENEEKILYHFMPAFQSKISLQDPIKALFAVSVGDEENTCIEPISPMHAVKAVAPNTLFQLRIGISTHRTLKSLSIIARSVDCFALKLGRDRNEITQFLSEFLST